MKKLRISLLFKIMLLCVGLVLVSSLTIRYFAYQTAEASIESTLGNMALNITRSVASTIDGDKHQELEKPEDMESEYYIELRSELNDIKIATGLKYLYTMARDEDGSFYYVVDGMDLASDDASLLGDIEEEISELMLKTFDNVEGFEFEASEKWGTSISSYVPIKNSKGDIIGLLGADFDAEHMVKSLKTANMKMSVSMGIILIFSTLVTILFSYLIIRSLQHLRAKVKLIQTGDLTVDINLKRSDEVGSLANAFQQMIDHMSFMIKNITKHSEDAIQDVESLNNSVDVSNRATEEITKIVGEIAAGAMNQVENVELVNESMGRVFTAIETITEHINTVNEDSDLSMKDMQEAADRINQSVQQINLVNDTIENTAVMMKKLENKFQEVLSFSSNVTSIASRTNLLALMPPLRLLQPESMGKALQLLQMRLRIWQSNLVMRVKK